MCRCPLCSAAGLWALIDALSQIVSHGPLRYASYVQGFAVMPGRASVRSLALLWPAVCFTTMPRFTVRRLFLERHLSAWLVAALPLPVAVSLYILIFTRFLCVCPAAGIGL